MGLLSFLSNNAADLIGAGIGAIGNIVAGNQANSAARQAANVAQQTADANIQFQTEQAEIARQIFFEALELGLQDLDEGSLAALEQIGIGADQARSAFRDIAEISAGGLERFRQIAGSDPRVLTPDQALAIEDTRRDTQNALDRSALRGSGRAQAAVANDVTGRMRADFFRENRDRADQAAGFLANENLGARRDLANLDTAVAGDRAQLLERDAVRRSGLRQGVAGDTANIESNLAQATTTARNAGAAGQIGAINTIGNNRADLTTATARLVGDAVGSTIDPLRRVVADAQRERPSRFITAFQ